MAKNIQIQSSSAPCLVYYSEYDNGYAEVNSERPCNLVLNSNIRNMFKECKNLAMSLSWFRGNFSFSRVEDMVMAFYNCSNLTGSPVCDNNVVYMNSTYYNCINLTGNPVCGPNVISMLQTYRGCNNLTGSPVCGNNVTSMLGTYRECTNLTGNPVCGPNVTNMSNAYNMCTNLTGSPVCGDSVVNMSEVYYGCTNLTGNPACGSSVVNMCNAYRNCYNLTGPVVVSGYVENMAYAYYNCSNISSSDLYLTYNGSNEVNAYQAFYGKPSTSRLNIHVAENGVWNSWLYNATYLAGEVSWTLDTGNGVFYNMAKNIYVYYHDIGTFSTINSTLLRNALNGRNLNDLTTLTVREGV